MVDFYLFKTALKDLLRPKRLVVALGLAIMPAALALLWRYTNPDAFDSADAYNTLASVLVYSFMLVILSVVFGTGVITQEIEQKTIVYMLTRPVQRWRIVLMKFVACVVVIGASSGLCAVLLNAACFMGGDDVSSMLRVADIKSPHDFVMRLKAHEDPVSKRIFSKFSPRLQDRLENIKDRPEFEDRFVRNVVRQTNLRTLRDDTHFYDEKRFADVTLRPETKALLAQNPGGRERIKLNRLLMEDAFSDVISPRKVADVSLVRDVSVLTVGAMAYGALFLLLATLLNRPLMIGLMFAFGWESWVPNMPGKFQMISIMTYLKVLAPHSKPPAETVDLLQFLSGGASDPISTATAWTVLLLAIAACLVAALFIFSVNEYVPREDAE